MTVLIVAGLMWIGSAQAVHDNGMFELDGNTTHEAATVPPYDWNSLFDASGNRLITPDPINGPLLADGFFSDSALPDQTYFTSNKDINPIASGAQHWGCNPINNPLAKDDLLNAYAALVQVPQNAPDNAGDQVLYLASERGSNNGTSFAGFWLLKDKNVGCSGSNAFSGQHTDGDILIVSNYTNGGGTQDVQVYRWTGNDATGSPVLQGSFNGSICSGSLSNDNACAIANTSTITTPWSPTSHDSNTFVETGIDLTQLLGANGGCFTNFLAETRSSAEITATLKDFAGGQFSTCVPPTISTTATPGGSTVALGATDQHDVATISAVGGRPTPTGSMTFFLCNPSQVTAGGCVSGGTQVGGAVTINSGSATSANAGGSLLNTTGKYCWRGEYTPDANGSKFYVAGSHTDSTSECFTVVKNSPTIATTPSPKSVTLGTSAVTLNDSAVLAGGSSPTGTITFTLVYKGSTVDTETVSVSGNGTYTTPTGYTLPTSGTVTGTYQWNATYSGDSNNNSVSENNDASEQVTVNPASPGLVTTASPHGTVTLDSGGSPTLNDSAVLAGGYHPTGTITFTLKYNGSTVYTDHVSVSGNGTYSTAAGDNAGGYTLPGSGTVTGSYVWTASYGGDGNNNTASDPGTSALEQVTVNPASPTVVTTANPNGTVTLDGGASPTLNDSAVLAGGYHPGGTITFTLKHGATTVYTDVVTVSGNGMYSTASGNNPGGYTLPTSGVVTGSYDWMAVYSGDGNNSTANDPGTSNQEQVTVNPAAPTVVTTANPHGTVTLDDTGSPTLNDSAVLAGGYHPTGTITFTLKYNGSTVYTDHVTVSGNGTYSTAAGDNAGGYTLPGSGTVTGSYVWTASYGGDGNNNTASDPGTSDQEQVTVNPASPTVVTTATPASVTLPGSVTFSDSAVLAGGYHPSGTLTFTLTGPNGFSYTQKDTVSGNGTYTASDGPISNPDVGTYTWTVTYSGDDNNNDAVDQGGRDEQTIVSPAGPGIVTTPDPTSVTLGTGTVTLKDSAVLSGGSNPTGHITFTLVYKGSTVDTEQVSVSGNGTYTTPAGYTLPSSGTVTGTYQWNASYSGDANNASVSENNAVDEQVTVGPASPSIVTTPDPKSATLGSGTITLNDSAVLSGGYHPTGSITFTLVYQGSTVDTETATVSGNGTYSTPTGYTLPSSGTVTGTYQWNATYTGDANNNSASENNDVTEQVTVNPAKPDISTTPSETTGSVNDVLNDTAHLSGGVQYDGSGTITFNLYGPGDPTCDGKPAYTETVTADHNGDYTTSNASVLADTAGIWNWTATFSGDSNNTGAVSGCGAEQVAIGAPLIHIHKTADKAQVNAGDDIGFTMTVWNSGSGDAKGVLLTDVLPTNPGTSWSVDKAGTGFGSGADCSINLGVLTCGPETVPAGTDEQTSTFWVHITSHTDKTTGGDCQQTGLVDNTGHVATTNDGTDDSSAEICVAAPAIHIKKTADATQVNAGDQIGFTMKVWNSGNGDAYGTTLTDQLPANPGLNWQIAGQGSGWTSACSISQQGVLTCGPDTVPAGTTEANTTFTVHITSTTDKTTGGDCQQTGLVDNTGTVTTSNDGTDNSSAEICVAAPAIHIKKTADKTQVNAGDDIGFTMTVWNSGIGDAKGVTLTDQLPANPGLSWSVDSAGTGFSSGADCSISQQNVLTCGPETVPAGTGEQTSTFWVHITSHTDKTTGGDCQQTGLVDNTGTVTTSNDGTDNSSAEICVAAPAIHIKKTADATQVNAGNHIGFAMTVWNSGIGDAYNTKLADPLPANPGLSWKIADQGAGWNGTCQINGSELDCGPVTVPAGTTQATSTFTVHITSSTTRATAGDCEESGLVDNTGTVTTGNDGTDNSSAQVCVLPADVSITKTADHSAPVHAGDPIGFTVEVKNTGTGAATGVKLSDPLPAGSGSGVTWAIDSSVGTPANFVLSGAKGSQTLSLASSTLPAGADYKVHVTARTSETECGTYDNTATLTTANANNPNPASAEESCVFRVDLSITKSGSPATQELGAGNITWTMVVTNNGPDNDTGVKISDPMPAGNTYVSSTTTQGTCTGGPILTCDIGPMAAGASVTITLVTTPSAVGPQTNTVVVSGDRSETNLANNTASATVQITGAPFVPCINIKRITPGHLLVGRKTLVTIYLQGNGRPVKGIQVRIKGAGVNVKTKGASGKGVIKHTLKMKRKGILTFTPIQGPASQTCSGKRIGVRGVFTPPVTG